MNSEIMQMTRVAAYGLVLVEARILLCRISDQIPDFKGYWTLPGGGLDFGEDPAQAMIREVAEETGLRVRPRQVAGIDSRHLVNGRGRFHSIRIMYHVELLGGELAYETDGSTDYCAWWSLAEARALPLVDLVEAALPLAFPNGRFG